MRRAFHIQLRERIGYDMVRCDECRNVWYTGNYSSRVDCADCGCTDWHSITDQCEECDGFAKLRPDPYYRECTSCGHMQRTDTLPKHERAVVIGSAAAAGLSTGSDNVLIGTATKAAKKGEIVEVQLTSSLPPGDSDP